MLCVAATADSNGSSQRLAAAIGGRATTLVPSAATWCTPRLKADGRGSAPFRRDCSQDCSQAAGQRRSRVDNCGCRPGAQTVTDGPGQCAYSYGSDGRRTDELGLHQVDTSRSIGQFPASRPAWSAPGPVTAPQLAPHVSASRRLRCPRRPDSAKRPRHSDPELLRSQLGVEQEQFAGSSLDPHDCLTEVRVVSAFRTAAMAIPSTAPPIPNPPPTNPPRS